MFLITRDMENALPSFKSHVAAAAYFKEQYGSDFVFEYAEHIEDMYCYFYALVVDHGIYQKGRKLLTNGQAITGELSLQFINSYQSIQIMEDGHIHIVY